MLRDAFSPGSIVRCRNRDWVLLPAETDEVWALRPLAGADEDVVRVHRGLADRLGYTLPSERVQPSAFPLPRADTVADAAAAHLLWQAARLTLREGATPFRSLGRISIRPRAYQFVPLMMALRLDPVRLFIADDVGVGKTIEALLAARELLDRGEIRQVCVLTPPALCEQWAREMAEKFNLEPVIIRSGTVSQLERRVPAGSSIYAHFPYQVVSIDFAKTERNRHQFLQFCPEFVIVDEAHGTAASLERGHQERHALVSAVAANPNRHLILLTATPHSGKEDAFRSLLGLLRPEFADWDLADLNEPQRDALAKHFVQRTRADIAQAWETTTPFPQREALDATYDLSPAYRELFERAYDFCAEIVQTGRQLDERRRRVRYWGALALLRCVMSSPAAAVATLVQRARREWQAGDDETAADFSPFVFEPADARAEDETPTPPVEAAKAILPDADRRRLSQLAQMAERLRGSEADAKLQQATTIARDLLREGFAPILWCRYIATAEYVAERLRAHLPDAQVVCVTGRMSDDEREAKIAEIAPDRPRVLVATDCLSEGVNLQALFNAVIHYDLPWNPNRLEQREGRVDRFGQPAQRVKVVRFFGRNNPVDGAVIRVLLEKARLIRQTLGVHVPVPETGESVLQAVLEALFLRKPQAGDQLPLDLGLPEVDALHRRWEQDVERERVNRTRFAQRALKPEVVQRELEATDAVLGDPAAVQSFVLAAAQRIGLPIAKQADVWRVSLDPAALATVPEAIRLSLPPLAARRWWPISFVSPTPAGAEYVGRNHRFVAALARYLLEAAIAGQGAGIVARCGAIRTRAVAELTALALLRVRYLLRQPDRAPLLAEEVRVVGWQGGNGRPLRWLADDEALRLLAEGKPDANLPLAEKQELVRWALGEANGGWQRANGEWWEGVEARIRLRAQALAESHKRVRQTIAARVRGLDIQPHLPPDLLGVVVLQPPVSG